MKKLLYAFAVMFVLFNTMSCTPQALNDNQDVEVVSTNDEPNPKGEIEDDD